jgi:hypothetical protein
MFCLSKKGFESVKASEFLENIAEQLLVKFRGIRKLKTKD